MPRSKGDAGWSLRAKKINHTAGRCGFPVLDLCRDETLCQYIPDGLHPNNEGHRLLAKKFLQFFKAL